MQRFRASCNRQVLRRGKFSSPRVYFLCLRSLGEGNSFAHFGGKKKLINKLRSKMSGGNPNTELLRFIRPGKREDGVFVPTPWAELKTQADPDLTKYQRKCYLVILSSALRMTVKEVLTAHEQEGDGVPLRDLMSSASAVVRIAKM